MAADRMPGLMPTNSTFTGGRTRSRSVVRGARSRIVVRAPDLVRRADLIRSALLRWRRERLAFFDQVGGDDPGRGRPIVRGVVHGAGRDQKRLAGPKGHSRLTVLLEQ